MARREGRRSWCTRTSTATRVSSGFFFVVFCVFSLLHFQRDKGNFSLIASIEGVLSVVTLVEEVVEVNIFVIILEVLALAEPRRRSLAES